MARPMRAGGEDEQRVEVGGPKQVVERDVPTVGGDPVALADGARRASATGRRWPRSRSASREPVEQRQVDGLGDGAEPEDAESDGLEWPAGRGLSVMGAEYIDATGRYRASVVS